MSDERQLEATASLPRGLFVVGAKKCGSTALHHLLRQHPQVAVCDAKEPEFYSHPQNLDQGLESYLDGFRTDLGRGCTTILDSSVAYSQYPYRLDSSVLIHRDFADAHIVYLVRDPVQRWFSDYLHEMRQGVYASPEEALVSEPRLLAASRYGEQLKRYIDVFGSERVLVLSLDALASEPATVAQEVFAHADLPPFQATPAPPSQTNRGGIDHYIRHRTTAKLFAFPGGEQIRAALPDSVKERGFNLVRSSPFGRRAAKSWPEPVFTEELRERVRTALADDMQDFRQLAGFGFEDLVQHQVD